MRISYVKLENFIGMYVGQGKETIEIEFPHTGNSIVSIQGRNGCGKAQPNSTLIPSPDGFIQMGDIKVGDKIFGSDGNIIDVTGVYPQGFKEIYEIELEDGRCTRCCIEHLWKVYHEDEWKILELSQMIDAESELYIPLISGRLMFNDDFRLEVPEDVYGIDTNDMIRISDIRKHSYEEATCIMVSADDHLYVTENFIITHNTILLSQLTPFAYPPAIDERSTTSLIRENHNGYKEIHYEVGKKHYNIRHYYKANKTSHTVKSYISMDGEELNENGNVRSFNDIVETNLGVTADMMRLMWMGSNLSSFISLTPAKRKEYIGTLIDEINAYMTIYRKVTDDLKVLKVLLTTNNNNLYNCHITDIISEQEAVGELIGKVKGHEKERDNFNVRLKEIESLESKNTLEELVLRKTQLESSLSELDKNRSMVISRKLMNRSLDDLMNERNSLIERKIEIQSKINTYRISIDTASRNIERLEARMKTIVSDHDMKALLDMITTLKKTISNSDKLISGFVPTSITSSELTVVVAKISSFNKIIQTLYGFGNHPMKTYLRLVRSHQSIDDFIKQQSKKNMSILNNKDIKRLIDDVLFENDTIVTPICDELYRSCPYYRFNTVLNKLQDDLRKEYDAETLNYIQAISRNIDMMLNEMDTLRKYDLPDVLKSMLVESYILDRLSESTIIDTVPFNTYLTTLREYEINRDCRVRVKQYEEQIAVYQKAGVDGYIKEIQENKESITFYRENINTLTVDLSEVTNHNELVDENIAILSKYKDSEKYETMLKSSLDETKQLLIPLENANREKQELLFSMRHIQIVIESLREDIKIRENKIREYNRLIEEQKVLSKKFKDLSIIQEAVSTKKGIPVLYMKTYLGRIKDLANSLLGIVYDDKFRLGMFNVTPDAFEIPYIKNGTRVADVKYASQSEVPIATMALSFALSNRASSKYNIIMLDEIDAGFDDMNRNSFLRMLSEQIRLLKAEQVFIISHNIANIVDIPLDVVMLSESTSSSKLQNVIYG